jgi:hypothetical protein
MLCLAGFTPVANVDHAPGESAGYVVRSRRYPPVSRSRARLGSLPSAIQRSVSIGSSPSNPMKISLRIFARRAACRNRSHRHTARKGHATTDATLAARARINVRSDPPSAKPAPGPMYAIGRGSAKFQITAGPREGRVRGAGRIGLERQCHLRVTARSGGVQGRDDLLDIQLHDRPARCTERRFLSAVSRMSNPHFQPLRVSRHSSACPIRGLWLLLLRAPLCTCARGRERCDQRERASVSVLGDAPIGTGASRLRAANSSTVVTYSRVR